MHDRPASPIPSTVADAWSLDPDVTFLNHGSFGACPRVVLEAQQRYRLQMEREPVRFFTRQMQAKLDASREALAGFVGANAEDLSFVPNATFAVNSVIRSRRWSAGDELLVTDHAYNACRNAIEFVAERQGVKVVVARIPFPIESAEQAIDAIVQCVTPRTVLALIDHITSVTALVLPIGRIVKALQERGVDTLVDGAHAPAMVALDLNALNAAYYTGNCHKWLCAPKGAAFLHVRRDRRDAVAPAVISHGYNVARAGRSRMHDLFDWIGTIDPTPWLCVADAIAFVRSLLPGGVDGLMQHNRALALQARPILCDALHISPPCPDDMIGSMAALPLPDDPAPGGQLDTSTVPTPVHALQTELLNRYSIEVPVYFWPKLPHRQVRLSAQFYNSIPQYERLAAALLELLAQGR